jgi:hypothetical protein
LINASNEARPYRVLLALSGANDEATRLDAWVHMAISLLREPGEVRLRGMVTIPPDQSLSEAQHRHGSYAKRSNRLHANT